MFQCDGACSCSASHVVGGDRELRAVVEQVVQQDLAGQHRQEGQHRRRGGRAEHVAEVARCAHQHVFDGVGEDAPALGDAGRQHAEILLQQHHVGGILRDISGSIHRNANVGRVQGQRVVDAVTEEAHRSPGASRRNHQARLLLGRDPGKDRVVLRRGVERGIVEYVHLGTGDRAFGHQTQVGADLFSDLRIVSGGHLDLDTQGSQLGQRIARRGLRFVGEYQEAVQREPALVVGR